MGGHHGHLEARPVRVSHAYFEPGGPCIPGCRARSMALAVPAVEDHTSRSRRELPRVRMLGQLQAQHTVAPGNPDLLVALGLRNL